MFGSVRGESMAGVDGGVDPLTRLYGQNIDRAPYNGVVTLPTIYQAYPTPQQLGVAIIVQMFSEETLISMLFPTMYTKDADKFEYVEYIAKLSPFGRAAPQAPAIESTVTKRKLAASMMSFARQYTIDGSCRNTPLEGLYQAIHESGLTEGMKLTYWLFVFNALGKVRTIHALQHERLRQKNTLVGKDLQESLFSTWTTTVGCINKRPMAGAAAALPFLANLSRETIQALSVHGMEPDFMLLPAALKTYLSLETKYFERPTSAGPIRTLLDYCEENIPGAASAEFDFLTAGQEAYHFRDMMIKWVHPIRTEDNPTLDVLESCRSLGEFWVVPGNAAEFLILDYPRHMWYNLANASSDTCIPLQMKDDSARVKHPTDAEQYVDVVFRPNIRFQTNSIFTGVKGEKTALALMGGFMTNPYEEKAVRRSTVYWEFSCGFLIVRNEHLAWLPDVLIRDYMHGGGVVYHKVTVPSEDKVPVKVAKFGRRLGDQCLYRYRVPVDFDDGKTYTGAHTKEDLLNARVLNMQGEWPEALQEFNDAPGYSWISSAGPFKSGGIEGIKTIEAGIMRITDYGERVCA